MFRMKLTLLLLFAIVLADATVWFMLDLNRESYVQEQVGPSLKAAETSWRTLAESRTAALKRYVADIMASDLPEYIAILRDNREEIKRVGDRTREEFRSRRAVPPERILSFVENEAKDALTRLEDRVAKTIKKPFSVEGGYPTYMRGLFASCLAETEAWPLCYFKLTYLPLTQVIFPQQKKILGAAMPELFVLVDPDGRTARLLLDNLSSSVDILRTQDPDKAASMYKTHVRENFQQTAPVLEQLRNSFEPMISSFVLLNDRAFVVVASRIESATGEYLGALIVGYEAGRSMARNDTMAVLGWRPVLEHCMHVASGKPGEEGDAWSARCEYEFSRVDKGILFVHNDNAKTTVVGSAAVGHASNADLAQFVRECRHYPAYSSDSLLAASIPIPLDFEAEGQGLNAVLYVDLEKSMTWFQSIKIVLLVSGIVIFLIGLLLIQFLMRSFTRPFERIDAAIHEVISGDFDAQFPFDFNEQMPRSMGQSLCIMKAVLLGQPLPEDVEQQDGWSGDLRIAADPDTSLDVSEGDLATSLDQVPASSITESATEYYKRLYREYVDARRAAGLDVSKVTYIRFVEKIAKTEMALRDKYGCKQVIFKIVKKDNQVSLVPVKVVEESLQVTPESQE